MLLISPKVSGHAPVEMRTNAFISMWEDVERISPDASAFKKVRAAYRHGQVFLTMPPFRNFWVAALPGIRTIIDWRDGWSIAIASGYGGTQKRKPFKAAIAKIVELATLVVADEIWTCTPGLLAYHARALPKSLRRKLKLIPNGHQMAIIPDRFQEVDLNGNALTAVCAGKFVSYGEAKVKRIVDTLAQRYPNARVKIRVIGSPEEDGTGVRRYIQNKCYRIEVFWEPRKPYQQVTEDIAEADLAIAVIRDQAYDFGSKIFDYVAAGTPVLDVFEDLAFREHFSGCFDTDYDSKQAFQKAVSFHRDTRISVFLGRPGNMRVHEPESQRGSGSKRVPASNEQDADVDRGKQFRRDRWDQSLRGRRE